MAGRYDRQVGTAWVLASLLVSGCGRLGFDRVAAGDGATGDRADGLTDDGPFPSSCGTLAPTCGSTGNSPCCDSPVVTGGTFYRSYDGVGYNDSGYPATVRTFRLDKYEVTVGRFRQFVNAGMGTQQNSLPSAAGGRTLNGMENQGGWDPAWNVNLALDSGALITSIKCNATYQSWTDTPGGNENRPMNCMTWYEAMAFCIWDGGFLPTETEWNYAASGGSEQRAYPWSNPASSLTIDCSYANYNNCVNSPSGGLNRVGSESPAGDGAWGHSDLGGNVSEWNLDSYASPYPATTCNDCANLTTASGKVLRGGGFGDVASFLRGGIRFFDSSNNRYHGNGVRCARTP